MKYNARIEDLEAALRQAGLEQRARVSVGSEFGIYAYVTTIPPGPAHRFIIDVRAGKIAACAATVDMVRRSTDAHQAGTVCPYCR